MGKRGGEGKRRKQSQGCPLGHELHPNHPQIRGLIHVSRLHCDVRPPLCATTIVVPIHMHDVQGSYSFAAAHVVYHLADSESQLCFVMTLV